MTRRAPIPSFREARVCTCGAHGFVGLTKGFVAFVSPDRVSEVARYLWCANVVAGGRKIYSTGRVHGRTTLLHRYLADTPNGFDTDHRNGDTLDNTDDNLRTCTRSQNTGNARRVSGQVPFKGVSKLKEKFRASINAKMIGVFTCPVEAARAYDAAAVKHFGAFAATNAALGLLPEAAE